MKRILFLLLLIPSLAWGQISMSGVSLSGCSSGGASAAAGCTISDDFSDEATEAKYLDIRDDDHASLAIAGGVLKAAATRDTISIHETTTGSNDHCVEATMWAYDSDDKPQLVLRASGHVNDATGYFLRLSLDGYQFYKFADFASITLVGTIASTIPYQTATLTRICAVTNGETTDFHVYVNGVEDNESPLSDATYMTGAYVGVGFQSNNVTAYIDNFKADASSTCMD